ncbi:MAG: hypothetical protein IKP38_01525 [Clostridia bacterium]|nr:hypothetical protein [Clostridia bacterium]
MIKLPINPLTPPISVTKPKQPKPKDPVSSGGSGGGSSGGGSTPDIPSFESLFQEMLKYYLPETVEFTPLDESVLSETIKNWLRPAYEQAIQNRRDQTERINAELDADAWSRGMGQSTYLSDVKERQYRGESRDVSTLESNYASELAGHLYDAMKEQQEKKIEVDEFNAEQINHAREQATNAAQALYRALLSGGYGSGGGGGAASGGTASEDEGSSMLSLLLQNSVNAPKSDYRTIANLVARMSPQERRRLYDRSDTKYLALRSEILWSLGGDEYARLMQQFPGA